jgi:hypothetical protein
MVEWLVLVVVVHRVLLEHQIQVAVAVDKRLATAATAAPA